MKVLLHIPTEQYGFVGVEVDDINPSDTARLYREYAEAFKPQPINKMADKDFNKIYDQLMNTGELDGDPGVLQEMSPLQQTSLNDLKKALKRHTYSLNK